jgi:hypothetical protein
VAAACAALLSACGGSGGGAAGPLGPLSISAEPALAGAPPGLTFRIALRSGQVGPADVVVFTADAGSSTGFATGGVACGGGVDYITVPRTTLLVPAGANSATLTVVTCPNAAFEPDERFTLGTEFEAAALSASGTIVNNAAGGLNDTGVTACLDTTGALVACSATDIAGQDGARGRDALALTNGSTDGRVGFAYADVAGGCRQDLVTGLVWDVATAATATLAESQARVAAANGSQLCGRADWRLPSSAELMSLVDGGATAGALIDGTRFPATGAVSHWSGEAYAADTRASWVVDFGSGAVAFEAATNPLAKPIATRIVAGGPLLPGAACDSSTDTRFTDHGNGTVTDRTTGLMWMQCAEGQSGAGCASGAATAYADFASAVRRAAAVNGDAAGAGRGFGDWRLPNRNELGSIVNRACTAPAIARARFPATPSASFWSATPAGAGRAWYVDFTDGSVGPGGTSGARLVRLVRAGN